MFIKWHIDNLVIYLHEKYNISKPYSYRQNVVTISSECEFEYDFMHSPFEVSCDVQETRKQKRK